ncbi:MAG: pyruvate kinase [Flammeovirgaceae bacterium]
MNFNNTKIIATVGPASNTKEKLLELVMAGVDVFRLNFSHGSHEDHLKVINHIKDINRTFNHGISILQDLQGPKIRIGEMEKDVVLKEGADIVIQTEPIIGNAQRISTVYTAITKDVKPGDTILIDDGKISLRVEGVDVKEVRCKVVYGGPLKSKKGMNLPDTDISEPSLTRKDREDLLFGIANDVDWIALSFVRSASDIEQVKQIIAEKGGRAKVVAKIERPEAIKNMDSIIEAADAIMVARGDLGVEIKSEDVPIEQKRLVSKSRMAAKPVIIATQMMESMIDNPRPTRAEANDVATAVYDGADAVMLSAETASGKYPIETVKYMTNIIKAVENQPDIYHRYYKFDPASVSYHSDIIVEAAVRISEIANAKAIVATTKSGFTAFHLSKHRPKAPIFMFTSDKNLLTTMNLAWGIRIIYYKRLDDTDETIAFFESELVRLGYLRSGDTYVCTAGIPLKDFTHTNMIKLSTVK